jgi:D-alanyl-D-alanine carboxypeptidase
MSISRFIIVSLMVVSFSVTSVSPYDAVAKTNTSAKSKTTQSAKTTKTSKATKSASRAKSKKVSAAAAAAAARRQEALFSALVVNAETGQILYEKNAASPRYPASLTKMMTLYLTFDALKSGKLKLDDRIDVSAKAAGQPQTNISLSEGDTLPVRSAIESLVVRSANDSAMVLAEVLGDTEWNFALAMTKKARELGMKDTIFRNPSGLPDNKQHTNAYDMARLAIALRRDFPEYYHFFKMKSFSYNGITYPGHNHVMNKYPGVDGVKTGFIRASGFNLVTSAQKDGHRIVAVVMGGSSVPNRDNQMMALLDRTFAALEQKENSVAKGEAQGDSAALQPTSLEAHNMLHAISLSPMR